MYLYHVGFEIIKDIDLKYGRKNADFGQGFYLSSDLDFSKKWARISNNTDTILNIYDFDLADLKILNFNERNEDWFNYIYKNRNNYDDIYKEYDVVIGSIANDTIFDLYGIVTSGLINNDIALKILSVGPSYTQIVIKSEKAKSKLKFINYEILNKEDILKTKKEVKKVEEEYQKLVFSMLDDKIKDLMN